MSASSSSPRPLRLSSLFKFPKSPSRKGGRKEDDHTKRLSVDPPSPKTTRKQKQKNRKSQKGRHKEDSDSCDDDDDEERMSLRRELATLTYPLPFTDCIRSDVEIAKTENGNPAAFSGFSEQIVKLLHMYHIGPEDLDNARKLAVACNAMRFLKLAGFHYSSVPSKVGLPLAPEEQAQLLDPHLHFLDGCKVGDSLGEGGFGTVYLARVPSGDQVAIKMLTQRDEEGQDISGAREGWTLSRLKHANIVQYIACGIAEGPMPEKKIPRTCFWLATEYLEGETLTQALGSGSKFQEPHLAYIAKSMLSALASIHSHHLVHRDLKPANIMLTIRGTIKLIDFGLAEEVKAPLVSLCGTCWYFAPESIGLLPSQYSMDIWALGISLLELAHGVSLKKLFGPALTTVIKHGNFGVDPAFQFRVPPRFKFSSDFVDFLHQCLTFDHLQRPSASALKSHPWLATACSRAKIRETVDKLYVHQTLSDFGIH
jgi:hypothetical protein